MDNPAHVTPPNILFVLADDWGYGDLGCYGNDESIAGWPMLGIRHEEHMLPMNPVTGQRALYGTHADEAQTRNLVADKPGLARSLAGQIEEYSRSLPGYPTRPGVVEARTTPGSRRGPA